MATIMNSPPAQIAEWKAIEDAKGLIAVLSQCLAGVMAGDIDASRANAVCNLANTAMRVIETAHKMDK